jgi:hypothetical protein
MQMTFEEYISLPREARHDNHLVEISLPQRLTGWEGDFGYNNVWKIALSPIFGSPPRQCHRPLTTVSEDGVYFTEVGSIAAVEATDRSWYWDTSDGWLYVQGAAGNPDSDAEALLGWFGLHLAVREAVFNGVLYEPIVQVESIPTSRAEGLDFLEGSQVPRREASIRLRNDVYPLAELLWDGTAAGATVRILFGGGDMPYSEYRPVFTGTVASTDFEEDVVTLQLRSLASRLDVRIPPNTFGPRTEERHPGCPKETIGRPVPLLLGSVTGVTPPRFRSKDAEWCLETNAGRFAYITDAAQSGLDVTGDLYLYADIFVPDVEADLLWAVITKWYETSNWRSYALVVDPQPTDYMTKGGIIFSISGDGTNPCHLEATQCLLRGQRNLIGVFYKAGSEPTVTIWVNGKEVQTQIVNGTLPSTLFNSYAQFRLGAAWLYLGDTCLYPNGGKIYEAAVATKSFSGGPPSDSEDVVGWWKLEGGLQDRSPKMNHLRKSGFTGDNFTNEEGQNPVRKAVSLNGSTQYYKITDADQNNLDITGALTIEAEIEPATISGSRTIASKWGDTTRKVVDLDGSSEYAYNDNSPWFLTANTSLIIQFLVKPGNHTAEGVVIAQEWRDWGGARGFSAGVDANEKAWLAIADTTHNDSNVKKITASSALSTSAYTRVTCAYNHSTKAYKILYGTTQVASGTATGGEPYVGYKKATIGAVYDRNAQTIINYFKGRLAWVRFVQGSADTNGSEIPLSQCTHAYEFEGNLNDTAGSYNLTSVNIAADDYLEDETGIERSYIFCAGGAKLELWISADGTNFVGFQSGDILEVGIKHRARAVFSPSNYVKLFLDDNEILSETSGVPSSVFDSGAAFSVGGLVFNGTLIDKFFGKIAVVAVENSAVLDSGRLQKFDVRYRFNPKNHYIKNDINMLADDLGDNHLTAVNVTADNYVYYDGGDSYKLADNQLQQLSAVQRVYHKVSDHEIDLVEGSDYALNMEDCELTVINPEVGSILVDAVGALQSDVDTDSDSGMPGRAATEPLVRASDVILYLLRRVAGIEADNIDIDSFIAARVGDKPVGLYLDAQTDLSSLLHRLCLSGSLLDLVVDDKFRLRRYAPSWAGAPLLATEELDDWRQRDLGADDFISKIIIRYGADGSAEADNLIASYLSKRRDSLELQTYNISAVDASGLAARLALLAASRTTRVEFRIQNLRLSAHRPGNPILVTMDRAWGPGGAMDEYPLIVRCIERNFADGSVAVIADDWRGAVRNTAVFTVAGHPSYSGSSETQRIKGGFFKIKELTLKGGQLFF